MDITETLYITTRESWREWLAEHHKNKGEIWLVSYRKEAGKPNLPYNDTVEEALCFGWIDSVRKTIDEARYAQRFSPRRPGSSFSQTNIERLRRLIDQGRVMPEVLAGLGDLDLDWFDAPPDIISALQAVPEAWANFQRYSGSYQRIRIAYVETARNRPGEFEKRLQNLIHKTAQNKQFGYGIEAYY
jgi:uncharacterized protein YdeI (YjbR/CyaY-like superfamily)